MIIQHNMLAMNNLYMGKRIQKNKAKVTERLSSGYKINRAADDAANMAISEKMQSRIRALARCQNNIEEGISLTQTADGALHEVNEMLNRVHELCVQAANDTNTTDDRSKIAEEITQIYDEMDRIFETTEFNTIPVFRYDGDNYYGPEPEYEYHESVTELPPGDLKEWGNAMFPSKQFDLAKPATAATAKLQFGQGVDLSDASSLDGTSFSIKTPRGYVYNIQFGTDQSTGSISGGYYINTNNYTTVQSAFNAISSRYSSFLDKVTVSGNQAVFTFDMTTENKTITADGITSIEKVENGAIGNGYSIYSDSKELNPVDSADNALKFDTTITQTLQIMQGQSASSALTANEKANIKQNTLQIYPNGSINFTSDINIDSISTVGELRQAITNALNTKSNYTAVYDSASGAIQVSVANRSSTAETYAYIYESNSSTTVHTEQTNSAAISVTQTQAATSERQAKYIIQVPSITDNNPYSFELDGTRYTVYNRNKYTAVDYSSVNTSPYTSLYSTTNATTTISSIIRNKYSSNYTIVDLGNGQLELTSKQLNDNTGINIKDYPTSLQFVKSSQDEMLSGYSYYDQNYSVSLNIKESVGDSFDTTALYGKGFMLNSVYYQFTGTGDTHALYSSSTKTISLDNVTSYADLCSKLEAVTGFTVEEDATNPGTITLSKSRKTNTTSSSNAINFSDGGPSGTFKNSATSSGGAAYKNPQAEIDFSMYDMDNLSDLYGSGFRITCATCPGEFINVMFCHDKSELDFPESFEHTDANGNTNTIHNYVVELKDVTHGSQIAANIAEQLKDDLDHFTEVTVSDTNPSVLIAQDKRSKDQNGRAEVITGVYTNFLYHVDAEKIPNPDDKVGGGRKDTDAYYAYCMIYAGDTEEKPYIPVHLPYLTLDNLKLEYPKEPWDSYEEITNVMNRSKNAAEVISMARSKIGADQNRLEHAFAYAANAEEQIAAANSRIKDTDMAEGVMESAKLSVLANVQEAMLTQIVAQPERILTLLQ